MTAIQQTVQIDTSRRHLWLEKPLPETFGSGRVNIMLTIDKPPVAQKAARSPDISPREAIDWLCGCCADKVRKGSVDRFLAGCRADKERELALEKRRLEERKRYARIPS